MAQTKFKETEIGIIPEDWNLLKIEDVSEVVGGGTPSTKISDYWDGDVAWITPRDLSTFKFRYIKRGERNITKEGLNKSSAKLVPKGTVLLSTRAPVGYLAIAGNEVTTNQGFRSLIPNDKTLSEFLFYLLKKNVEILKSNSTGTTFGELSGSRLKSLQFAFPETVEQKVISKILSDLDSKIELLQQQNKTLEKIGLNLFKEYVSESEKIGENWQELSLDEIAHYLNGLALQKYPPKGEDDFPVIKIKELKQGITENTDKANSDVPQEYIVDDGDILFSWSGSLEVVMWCGGKGALNQHLFKVTSKKYPKWFYYYWTLHHLIKFKGIAAGKATTMGHINRKHLSEAKVLVPPKQEMEKLNEIFNPIIDKLITINLEMGSLRKTRDLLLPKLMSGKIRVPVEVLR